MMYIGALSIDTYAYTNPFLYTITDQANIIPTNTS